MRKDKRAGKQPMRRGRPRWLWPVLGGGVVVIVGVVIMALLWPRSPIEAQALPERGDQSLLRDVQSFPSEGQEHVAQGASIDYKRKPPTSGSHYPNPTPAGFYTEPWSYGNLVHSLEHGAVVIYYDPKKLSEEAERSLKAFAAVHRNPWASVIAVPNPEPNPDSAYVLTAWTKMLKLETYDVQVVRAFLAEYLGRGPENRVR